MTRVTPLLPRSACYSFFHMPILFWFSSAVAIENVHPLQWGIFRIKHRKDRRANLPIEARLSFYATYAKEIARKATTVARRWRRNDSPA
jgi:hypothetical protein